MTTFWTFTNNLSYTVSFFSLKNISATYQLAMTVIFYDMLHDCQKDYVDDIAVKCKEIGNHVNDLGRSLVDAGNTS